MKTSESFKSIASAMQVFHENVEKVIKSAENPFFKSSYAPLPEILEAIKEPLKTAGLAFMQFPKGENELETIVMHSETGEWMSESFYMKPSKGDPQAYGSVITYQRRYALGAIFGLNIDDDDDANKASEPTKKEDERPWLNDKTFKAAMTRINDMKTEEERKEAFTLLELNYRMKKDYREQLAETVETPFLNLHNETIPD